ncbi:MAG TPA: dienelactone hydrolase family protein [Gaiellaceae bacterium]|nr:dienelactone hydrolase family protein [Gaiellaceae bacterium]
MCFDLDSGPPISVISGAAISHEDLVLEASDGNKLAAFLATPDEAAKAGVVILPDVRGLYRFYEELALRFAERGYAALAIDYFGRTAGVAKREDDWDYMAEVEKTRQATVAADTRAAVERLRAEGCTSIFTVGFCFGGSSSWLAGADGHGLAGAVGFYGNPTRERFGEPSVVARVGEITVPILALQGGDDAGITHEDNEAFERALTEAGVQHEIVEFEGAPHSFFDRKQAEF